MLKIAFLFLFAYLLSSIPFGLVIARFKGVDLRKIGSGNIGTTNVYRAMGLKWAIVVFFLDALKGTIPVLISQIIFPHLYILHVLIALMAILGHSLSVFAKFKGGKGAATSLGVLCILSPSIFLVIVVIALIVFLFSRTISITTLSCAVVIPFLFYFFHYPKSYVLFVLLGAIYVILRHKDNIGRILRGEEKKLF